MVRYPLGGNLSWALQYLLGLKEPRFVTGYTGPEIDIALFKREIDARVTTGESIVRRSPEWLEKKLVDIHVGIEIPKGERSQHFASLPELESFTQSAKEKKIVDIDLSSTWDTYIDNLIRLRQSR